ncbi:MAG: dTDP-4-dehydrorhamnose reductase [Desulfovibrionaceae bacterium]|nr:dTDP-4-dehydrorhamnose reductase [Desulfovibrionaceae bacterium]
MTGLRDARAVVFGGRNGLLGQALSTALIKAGCATRALSREELGALDHKTLARALKDLAPSIVFNAAAYTQVDRAEDEPDLAFELNQAFPARLAEVCKGIKATLVHYSTDFVFDGDKAAPYTPDDEPAPLNVYGRSKLAGERAVLELGGPDVLVVRSSWLFGPGKTNFVRKILELARERRSLAVVHDRTGSPTYTPDLAENTLELVVRGASGIFHLANAGMATWCELAAEAVAIAGLECRIEAIAGAQYPAKAERPAYSVLDTSAFTALTGKRPRPWAQALREYVFKDLRAELAAR